MEPRRHEALLGQLQRLRGQIYLRDGAIRSWNLTPDGRHRLESDRTSWHVVVLNDQGSVCGCVKYMQHPPGVSFQRLWMHRSALAYSPVWGTPLRGAVESEVNLAQRRSAPFAEIGGWAIDPERRATVEAVRMVITAYALGQATGGAIMAATATTRHNSSSILRRTGAAPFRWQGMELPPYYDPQYRCEMEILRFDTMAPHARYAPWVLEVKALLAAAPVVCADYGYDELSRLADAVCMRPQGQPELAAALAIR